MNKRMPSDLAARYAQLDAEGRRCEGNSRRCTSRAVEEHTVHRKDPDGNIVGELEIKRTCGRHRQQISNSALWQHVDSIRMTGLAWPATDSRWSLPWRSYGNGIEQAYDYEIHRVGNAFELRLRGTLIHTGFSASECKREADRHRGISQPKAS